MAHILVLSLVFPPDGVSTAHIMGDLVMDLQKLGHTLTVITTQPHYNRDLDAEDRQPIITGWGGLVGRSEFHGIPVYHTIMPRKGKNVLFRVLAWLGFHLISTYLGIFLKQRPDVILAPSPPLTIGIGAWLLGLYHRAPFIYNAQEIFPDIAISLGTLRNPLLIRFLFALERFVYHKASRVTVIAPQMRARLLAKQVEPEKVVVIPNFVDLGDFRPLPKENDFSQKYNLQDQFVVSYAGNMGPAQQLEVFLEAANILRDEPLIHCLMMGDGILQPALQRQVEDYKLTNFTLLPYQPYTLMPQIYAASDLCLVPLAPQTGGEAVPSKVYRIMACARPILAIAEDNSDLAKLVVEADCGFVLEPGSAIVLANAIREACRNLALCKQKGMNGYEHVLENYARNTITRRYNNLIEELLRAKKVSGS